MCSKANNIVNRFHQRGDIYQETGINYSERATLVLYFNRSRVSLKFLKIELTKKFRFDFKMIADNPGWQHKTWKIPFHDTIFDFVIVGLPMRNISALFLRRCRIALGLLRRHVKLNLAQLRGSQLKRVYLLTSSKKQKQKKKSAHFSFQCRTFKVFNDFFLRQDMRGSIH